MIPKRSEDPIGYAKFWFGPDLWGVLIDRASILRLSLHSGLVPGHPQREALRLLKRFEQRNLLTRVESSGGRIQFAPHPSLKSHLLALGEQRAAQKGQA